MSVLKSPRIVIRELQRQKDQEPGAETTAERRGVTRGEQLTGTWMVSERCRLIKGIFIFGGFIFCFQRKERNEPMTTNTNMGPRI